MVMIWRYWLGSIKENVSGNPNCSRINHDNTRATNPIASRRHRVLDGDDFGVLAKDVLRHPTLRMVKLYFADFGKWDNFVCAKRDIDHQNNLLALFCRCSMSLSFIVQILLSPKPHPPLLWLEPTIARTSFAS